MARRDEPLFFLDSIQMDWFSRNAPRQLLFGPVPCSIVTQLPFRSVLMECLVFRLYRIMAIWRSTFAQALDKKEALMTLYKHLAVTWVVPDDTPTNIDWPFYALQRGFLNRSHCHNGTPVVKVLRNLVLWKA